jgi:hypothetical protein
MTGATRFGWLRSFLVVLLAVVVPVALYYFVYAMRRAEDAERRQFRILAEIQSAMQARTMLQVQVLRSAAYSGDQLLNGDNIREALRLGRLLELRSATAHTPAGTPPPGRVEIEIAPRPQHDPELTIKIANSSGDVVAAAPLRNVIPWELAERDFDGLVVRRLETPPATGTTAAAVNVRPMLALHLPEQVASKLAEAGPDLCEVQAAAQGQTGSTPRINFLFTQTPGVTLSGTEYKLFCLPLDLRVPPHKLRLQGDVQTTAPALQLIGVVQLERLRKNALELSPKSVTLVAFALLAALLMLPYLKVRFMAHRERMRALDMWLLGTSAFSGTALALLFILHLWGHAQLLAEVDAGMRSLAVQIQEQVAKEVAALTLQLERGAQVLAKDGACLTPSPTGRGRILTAPDLSASALPYPDFEALFCTDDNGVQSQKWMPRTNVTHMVPVADYPYFPRTLAMPESGFRFAFDFDVLDAKTTGLELAMLAEPLDGHTGEFGAQVAAIRRTGIVGIANRLRTLMNVPVPVPYQYVVVNNDGEVLLRSQGLPEVRGGFFTDIEGAAALLQEVRNAPENGLAPGEWRYRGRRFRMEAFRLHALPAILVVFYDDAIVEGTSAEVLITCVPWIALLLVLTLLAVAAARLLRPRGLDWLWPTVNNWALYACGSAVLVAFAAALTWGALTAPVWCRAYGLVLVPPLMVFLMLLLASTAPVRLLQARYGLGERMQEYRPSLHPQLYLLFTSLALVVFAGVPTVVVFTDAFEAQAAGLRELSIATQEQAIAARHAADAQRFITLPDQCTREPASSTDAHCRSLVPAVLSDRIVVKASLANVIDKQRDLGVYRVWRRPGREAPPPSDTSSRPSCLGFFAFDMARPRTFFTTWMTTCLPIVSALIPALGEAVYRADVDAGSAALQAGSSHAGGSPGLVLVGAACMLLIYGVRSFTRSVATHILGLNFEGDGVWDRAEAVHLGERWLLLRPTNAAMDQLTAGLPAAAIVDLADASCSAETLKGRNAADIVVLLNLDQRLGDAPWRNALRDFLSVRGRPVIVASEIDPLHYLSQHLATATGDPAKALADEVASWAAVLATMGKARYALPSSAPMGDPQFRRRSRRFLEQLDEECSCNELLRGIQGDLLTRPDVAKFDWEDMVEYVLDMAEPYYRRVWSLCSEEERLTLIQLAQEGVINPRAFDVLRRLRRRRLIRTDPRFRLMNESFKRFVLECETAAVVKQWETPDPTQSWARLRTPLVALLVVFGAILVYIQQPFFDETATLAAGTVTVAGSVAAMVATARAAWAKMKGTA